MTKALERTVLELKKSKLKIVTMDIANAYFAWISQNFPQVHIVFDHFHVVKLSRNRISSLDQIGGGNTNSGIKNDGAYHSG